MESIGKYQVIEKIGVGGFGVVYKAIDPHIKRSVAIKTCSAEDKETRERFMREAEIAGNLQHRNIVTVFDFGFHEQTPYIVQEYLSGEDLDRKIKRRDPLTLPEKILYLVQIGRGLAYAHARGIVHRDIKPGNIRILEDDTAKIMDFGIAKLAQQQSTLTQAGMTLGTAAYLAPEQIRGEAIDQRTDMFSFGVMAYELLTFDRPFADQQISTIFYKILNEQPRPIRELSPDTPVELEKIVHKCIEKRPDDRFPTTAEMLRELETMLKRRGADSGEMRSSNLDATGEAPTAAMPTQPASATAQTAASPVVREQETRRMATVGEIELDTHQATPQPQSRGMTTMTFQGGSGGKGWVKWAAAAAVVAVAGVGVAFVLQQRQQPTQAASPTLPAAGSQAGASGAPAGAPSGTAAVAVPPAASPGTSPAVDPSAGGVGGAAPAIPGGTGSIVPPAPTPAPPVAPPPVVEEKPKPATLKLPKSWSPDTTVRVGGQTVRLDQEHAIELAPGTYTLQFGFETTECTTKRDVKLTLRPGQTQTAELPIGAPGQLTIQPQLKAKQGFVRIDGEYIGAKSYRNKPLCTGEYTVEIFASEDTSQPALIREVVTVPSQTRITLSYDLATGQVVSVPTPLAVPGA